MALRLLAAAGLLVYGWAVVEIGLPQIRVARRARPSAGRASLVMVPAWFAVLVGADVVVVATGRWSYLDALGVAMLSGVLFQAIAASLAYVAPLLLRSDAVSRARLSERIDRYATARAIAWNIGVACTALAAAFGSSVGEAGSVAIRVGWGLVLAATLWLGGAILFPSTQSVADGSDGREVEG